MVKVAIVGTTLAAQIAERPDALRGIEVASSTLDLEPLLASSNREFGAVILELGHLGDDPRARLDALFAACKPQLVVVTYNFARRGLLQSLTDDQRVRLLQSPTTLASVRASMLSLIVSGIFQRDSARGASPRSDSQKELTVSDAVAASRRFSRDQLARLLEISSTIQCECPNHLSKLVSELIAFEDYARDCESKSVSDREMHGRLYRTTVEARAKMEEALAALLVYERIEV